MIEPHRIQRKKTKGWVMPENTVYVGMLSKWGNPFVMHHPGTSLQIKMTPEMSVKCFISMVDKEGSWSPIPLPWPKGKIPKQWTTIEDVKTELRGKNLACDCPLGSPCHADILLRLAKIPIELVKMEGDEP